MAEPLRKCIDSETWRVDVEVNKPGGLRYSLAAKLRALAQKLDGRKSLALHINTTPTLERQQEFECIRFGVSQMVNALELQTKQEAMEILFKRIHVELFSQQGGSDGQKQ